MFSLLAEAEEVSVVSQVADQVTQSVTQNVTDGVSYLKDLKDYILEEMPAITGFCMKVVLALAAFLIGRRLIRFATNVVKRYLKKTAVDPGVIQFTGSLMYIGLYVILLFGLGQALGIRVTSVAALLGTATVTLGLALQGALENLAGGLLILIFRPFQLDDYIVGSSDQPFEGVVAKIEICYTTLVSLDNKQIVVPNGTLAKNTMINVTAKKKRRLELKVTITYESDLLLAKEILREIFQQEKLVEREGLEVFVDELKETGVCLGVWAWIPTAEYLAIRRRVNEKVKLAFDQKGIRIAYPQLVLHTQQKDTGTSFCK